MNNTNQSHMLKDIARRFHWMCRGLTSPIRLKPDYLIIGAMRAGTTSLFRYLATHPNVAASRPKEVHYYDRNFDKGLLWYRMHFPTLTYRWLFEQVKEEGLLTGEASPYYLFHPHVPKRVASDVPNAKLIVLLRNPVERAFSHYQHSVRHSGRETLSFIKALEYEEERTRADLERLMMDETAPSRHLGNLNYKGRGHYAEQIMRWLEYFDQSQLLILSSEKFFQNTHEEYLRVLEFLGLPERMPGKFKRRNVGDYADSIDAKTREYLKDYFKPFNQELYELLGVDFGWEL
jgi:hypothetical protein